MTRLLTRLRSWLPWLRVCPPEEHRPDAPNVYHHLSETNQWWWRCRRCPWMAEDRRILMRGDVPVRRAPLSFSGSGRRVVDPETPVRIRATGPEEAR